MRPERKLSRLSDEQRRILRVASKGTIALTYTVGSWRLVGDSDKAFILRGQPDDISGAIQTALAEIADHRKFRKERSRKR